MTCSWSEERFERFLDGDVNGPERERLLAHVDACSSCSGLLEELRVVDGLLVVPTPVELPADFVAATMAEVQALPEPVCTNRPVLAWLTSFVVGGWALIAAATLIMPATMIAIGTLWLQVARDIFSAFGGVGHVFGHLGSRGTLSSWTVAAGGIMLADIAVLVAVIAASRILGPRLSGRLRW